VVVSIRHFSENPFGQPRRDFKTSILKLSAALDAGRALWQWRFESKGVRAGSAQSDLTAA
jgi:hypothetical protein